MQQIFVGDVQGCAAELEELLARGRSSFGEDFHLWSVGDLINRGPDNLQALSAVRELVERGRASLVLGNHEISLLLVAFGLRELRKTDTLSDVLERSDLDDWVEWLRRRPLAVTGAIGATPFAMVHAAVHPDWDLESVASNARAVEARLGHRDPSVARALLAAAPDRDPERSLLGRFTSCRSVNSRGDWAAALPSSSDVAWHAAWTRRRHRYGVVYGHWALQGLHVAPGLRGLDTGCVHHGRGHDGFLTAWVPKPDAPEPFGVPDERFWQVAARARYYHDHLSLHA